MFPYLLLSLLVYSSSSASPFVLEKEAQGQYKLSQNEFAMKANETLSFEMHFEEENHTLSLERFYVTDERTTFVIGSKRQRDRLFHFNPDSVILLRGSVDGNKENSVFLAISKQGAIGIAQIGETNWSLTPTTNQRGLTNANLRWHRHSGNGNPPLGVPVCGAISDDLTALNYRSHVTNTDRIRLDLAIETDFEYLELFEGDLVAASEYIVALYGAVASIYERDVDLEIVVVYSRLWETVDDLFNDDDPLSPFANHWNNNMTEVDRDLAQFLTGRTNLPYGGVAWLSATCSTSGYSVSGYTMGSFYSTTDPNFGNWDLIVTSHELGHNCGTYHTHDYGIDECANGAINRGSIMSYCHTTTGGNANIDMRFHKITQDAMRSHLENSTCLVPDCNGNGQDDVQDILLGFSKDQNQNDVPDECEDCNKNGVFDSHDIASGNSQDANNNGLPDECDPDCNENGLPDSFDISNGSSNDVWGNGIPDECETDCDSNGQSDYNQIQQNMMLDINRNAFLDGCEDCDANGTPDHVQLQNGGFLWIAGGGETSIKSFHPSSGVNATETTGENVLDGRDVRIDGDNIYVSDGSANRVVVFDRISLEHRYTFSTGLTSPEGLLIQGNKLLIVSKDSNSVEQFDLATHAHDGAFIPSGFGGLNQPRAIAKTEDGAILVTSSNNRVLEYTSEGNFTQILISNSGGLSNPRGILQRPTGTILVTSFGTNSILEYDRNTGGFIGRFDRGGLSSGYWGLGQPWALRLGPDGDVYVSTNDANTAVQVYEESTGLFKRRFYILSQLVGNPTGFDFAPASIEDCNENLIVDACDIADELSDDVNNDGIPDECQCITDINKDDETNVSDLLTVIDQWGQSNSPADVNGDGDVNVTDLLMVISNWGSC